MSLHFYDPTNPYSPIFSPTLAAQKKVSLANAYAEKTQRLTPQPIVPALDLAPGTAPGSRPSESSNLIDIGQASIYAGNERLFDLIHGRTDRTPQEIQEYADFVRGVTPEARARFVDDPNAVVGESLANASQAFGEGRFFDGVGNIIGAAGNAILAGPGNLANSANVVPEALAGVALTIAAPPLGGAVIGKKIFGGAKVTEKIVKGAKKVSKTAQIAKAAAAGTIKTASQMSVVTASITQGQMAEFKAKHGVDMTSGEVIRAYFLNLVTMAAEGGIIKKLILPDFKKEFFKEVKNVAKNMVDGSNLLSIADRVAKGLGKMLVAGGAEFAQEYAQTWVEIINVEIGPEEGKKFLSAIANQLGKSENQAQAKLGGFLGFGAGFVAKGAIAAPAVAAGSALDLTKATAKGVVTGSKKAATALGNRTKKQALSLLSSDENAAIQNKFEVDLAEQKNLAKTLDAKLDVISKAKTFDDITDDEIRADFFETAGNDDLKDQRVFDRVVRARTRQYRGDKVSSIVVVEGQRAISLAAAEAQRIATNVSRLVNVTQEDIDKLVAGATALGEAAIKEIKTFNTSATFGLAEKAMRYGKKQTKDGLSALKVEAANNTPEVIRKLADALAADMPKVSTELNKFAERKERGLEVNALKTDSLVNMESLPFAIKDIVQRGKIPTDAISIGKEIQTATLGTFEDTATIDQLKTALDIYTADPIYATDQKGALSESVVKGIYAKLAAAKKDLKNVVVEQVKDIVKTVASHSDDFVAASIDNVGDFAVTAVKALDEAIASFIATKPEAQKQTTVKDPNTKVTYKIKTTRAGESFLAGLSGRQKQINALKGEDKATVLSNFRSAMSTPAVIQQMAETFGTTDPDAIIAIVNKVFPAIAEEGRLNAYRELVVAALAKTKPAPATTVTRENSETAPEGKLEMSEDGHWMIDEVLTDAELDAAIDATIGKENVCSA